MQVSRMQVASRVFENCQALSCRGSNSEILSQSIKISQHYGNMAPLLYLSSLYWKFSIGLAFGKNTRTSIHRIHMFLSQCRRSDNNRDFIHLCLCHFCSFRSERKSSLVSTNVKRLKNKIFIQANRTLVNIRNND